MTKYDQMGQDLLNNLSKEEKDAFDYLFPLTIDHLVFGNYTKPHAVGSFQNNFGTLEGYFAFIATKLKADTYQGEKVKATAYYLMLSIACLGALITKKANYVFKGPTYNWTIGVKDPKYMSLQVIFDMSFGYATFMLWDDARKSDYIKVTYTFGEAQNYTNYLTKSYSNQKLKIKVNRFGSNAKQRTVEVALPDIWKTLKDTVGVITAKTVI